MPNTKQFRISDPVEIRKRITEFLGKKINIVMADNRVMVGDLEQVNADGIVLRNMRLKKMFFLFRDLNEIYFDIRVA